MGLSYIWVRNQFVPHCLFVVFGGFGGDGIDRFGMFGRLGVDVSYFIFIDYFFIANVTISGWHNWIIDKAMKVAIVKDFWCV